MAEVVDRPAPRVRAEQEAPQAPALSLFWRLFLGNGVVFAIGATVLALSPATVSTPVVLAELAVLAAGLVLILAVNAVLTRAVLRPL
ncbi:MAG TPA: sensor histidine kinase, partial [Pseudonocardia sp.]|nr:sensor histidine kinase [Pseudonocardia sp.]